MNVQPSAHSRRENAVSLTPAGTDLARRGDIAFEQARAAALPAIEPDDLRAAIRALAAMNDALAATGENQTRK